jgi:ankyrin repeat protein
MLAMPNLEEAKPLIEHGAKINARSKSRFSALMVAAQYPQSSSTIRLLLSQGAEVQMAKGAGRPLFNATPLMLAAGALNAEIIKPLHEAGDDINTKMVVVGRFPNTPLLQTIGFGDVTVIRASIDFGAPALVELLLKSGANPQAKTKEGLNAAGLAKKYGYVQLEKALQTRVFASQR